MKDLKLLKFSGNLYGIYNDIEFDTTGDLKIVSGKDKTKQNIVKILLTKKFSNIKYLNYGSFLQDVVNLGISKEKLREFIKESIVQSLIYLKNIEQSNDENENIKQINSINLSFPSNEPREMQVNIEVTLNNDEKVKVSLEE